MKDIIRVRPDSEKAKSLLKMAVQRQKMIKTIDSSKFTSPKTEEYYEIIKELASALLALDGMKTLSHKVLIDYLKKFKELSTGERLRIDELRKIRNRIAYNGFFVPDDFLARNERVYIKIISKLKSIITKKLKG